MKREDSPPSSAPPVPTRRPRSAAFLVVSLVVGLGSGLLIAEVVLRVFGADHGGVLTVRSGDFARLPGIFDPGRRVTMKGGHSIPHTIRIDSLGYRSEDFPRMKPEGEFRIPGNPFSQIWPAAHVACLPTLVAGIPPETGCL